MSLSARNSEIYRRIDELSSLASKDPAQVQKVLPSALEELKMCLEGQSLADDERKRAEEALRESELRYRGIIETAEEGIATHGPDGTITYVNKRMADMLGYSPEEIIGRSSLDFADKEERQAVTRSRESLRERGSFSTERKLRRKDGSILWTLANLSPRQDGAGSFLGYLAMHTDITERKRTEETLRLSEEKYRHLVEGSGSIILRADKDMRITFMNQYGLQFFGYSPKEIIGKRALGTIIPIKDNEGHDIAAMAEDLMQHPDRYTTNTHQNMRKDGKLVWVSWANKPIYDDQGNLVEIFAIGNDLSKLKEAEAALRESEERYRTRFNALIEGFCVIEMVFDEAKRPVDYRLIEVNQAFEEQTGLHDAQGKLMRDLAPEHEEHWFEIYGKIALTGESARFENEARALNRWYEVRAFRVGGQESRKVGICFNDITERKRAEGELRKARDDLELRVQKRTKDLEEANEALQESEEIACQRLMEIEDLYRNAPVGLCVLDTELRWVRINERLAEINGFPAAMHIGKHVRDLMPLLADEVEQGMRKVLETGQPKLGIEIVGETPSHPGVLRSWLESWLPIKDAMGKVLGLNIVVEETTERKRAEEELLKAKEAAEAAVEAKAAFLANMSHELRTPLNAVIGYSSLLLDDNLTHEQKEYIESIRNGGEALLSIISDVLEFSRAEKERVLLEHQPLSLKHCIEESLDMVAVHASKKGLNLAYTVSYGSPDTIIGDHGRLRQILVNLLSNAVKFTDNGDISVSVSSKVIEGNTRQITFAVKDTGVGMPQDKMDRLFQPFTQLEYVISRKRDGAGLGLAICKKLVELMGGEIWAESEEGRGSTFRFTILAEAVPGKQLDSRERGRDHAYDNLSEQRPLAILVAEDNPSNQKVLVEMLKRMGYRPDSVADGREVLQALEIRPYDLVFMDIRMPEMDGLTAAREIRKLWPNNGPKVVAITAFAMEGDREKCIEAGMDDYISKPVQIDELRAVLEKTSIIPVYF